MSKVKRYHVRTNEIGISAGFESSHGPWVRYEDHAKEIDTLRAQVIRRDEEISDLRHEIESARDAARGENALRLEAERERDTLRDEVERRVKEIAHLKLAAEKAEREWDDRCLYLILSDNSFLNNLTWWENLKINRDARRSWAINFEAQSEERDDD